MFDDIYNTVSGKAKETKEEKEARKAKEKAEKEARKAKKKADKEEKKQLKEWAKEHGGKYDEKLSKEMSDKFGRDVCVLKVKGKEDKYFTVDMETVAASMQNPEAEVAGFFSKDKKDLRTEGESQYQKMMAERYGVDVEGFQKTVNALKEAVKEGKISEDTDLYNTANMLVNAYGENACNAIGNLGDKTKDPVKLNENVDIDGIKSLIESLKSIEGLEPLAALLEASVGAYEKDHPKENTKEQGKEQQELSQDLTKEQEAPEVELNDMSHLDKHLQYLKTHNAPDKDLDVEGVRTSLQDIYKNNADLAVYSALYEPRAFAEHTGLLDDNKKLPNGKSPTTHNLLEFINNPENAAQFQLDDKLQDFAKNGKHLETTQKLWSSHVEEKQPETRATEPETRAEEGTPAVQTDGKPLDGENTLGTSETMQADRAEFDNKVQQLPELKAEPVSPEQLPEEMKKDRNETNEKIVEAQKKAMLTEWAKQHGAKYDEKQSKIMSEKLGHDVCVMKVKSDEFKYFTVDVAKIEASVNNPDQECTGFFSKNRKDLNTNAEKNMQDLKTLEQGTQPKENENPITQNITSPSIQIAFAHKQQNSIT